MASHVISVCVFCLICATHSPCGSHAAVTHENPQINQQHDPIHLKREKFKEKEPWENSVLSVDKHIITKRQSDEKKDFYLKKLFHKFGDGKTLTLDGFQNLLEHVFELQSIVKQDQDTNETVNKQHSDIN